MPGHADRRPWSLASAVTVAATAFAVTVTACGGQATGAAGDGAPRFAATAADGSPVPVPGTRPVVMDFVSAGCDTGLATLSQAKTADQGADFIAVDIDPAATAAQTQAILTAAGAPALATAADPRGDLAVAYRIEAVGTTVVQAPDGTVVYTGIDPSRATITSAIASAAHR
jgi:hypothetical protein